MQQGGWNNANKQSTPNGSNVETGASESTISAEDGRKPGTFLNKIKNESSVGENEITNEPSAGANITNNQQGGGDNGNNPSTPNATGPDGGSNVVTGALERTIAAYDGQTPDTLLKKK